MVALDLSQEATPTPGVYHGRVVREALESDHRQIAELTATAGPQNYLLPEDVDSSRIRSVVIWCEPVRTAYAAATLTS